MPYPANRRHRQSDGQRIKLTSQKGGDTVAGRKIEFIAGIPVASP
jgi:hypothetical protein